MYSEHKNDGSRALVTIAILAFICLGVWWLESRFNALVPIMVIGGLVGVACFAGGAFLSSAVQRNTLENLAKFNQADAMTDKYRMMSMNELARGNTAWQKANAQLSVLDAKRVDQLAQQRAGLLMDTQRTEQTQQQDAGWWNAPQFEDDTDQS